jgi:hypothetical protein
VHVAGLQESDFTNHEFTHRGLVRFIDDPAVAAELCDALGV